MEIPVPNDWDGESYKCVQIEWPDSAQWFAILTGLITTMARGYTWRVFTKEENDAIKAIGLDIVGRNLPYVPCVTCDDNGPDTPGGIQDGPDFSGGFGYACDEMEDEMPGITWLEWDDNQLYMYFGPCCRVAVEGEISPGTSVPPDSPVIDPPEESPDYACRRAYYMAKALMDVADKVVDVGDDLIPTPTTVMLAFPEFRFNVGYLLDAIFDVGPMDVATNWTEEKQAEYLQTLACRFAPLVANDALALTDTAYNAMISVVGTAFDGATNSMLLNTLRAIGQGDISDAGLAGLFDDTVNCDCPSPGLSIPVAYDWLYDLDFRLGAWGMNIPSNAAYEPGIGFTVRDMGRYDGLPKVEWTADSETGTARLRFVRLYWASWPSSSSWSATNWLQVAAGSDWSGQGPIGSEYAEQLFDMQIPDGASMLLASAQATGDPTSGDAIFYRAILAGTGTPPFENLNQSDPPT